MSTPSLAWFNCYPPAPAGTVDPSESLLHPQFGFLAPTKTGLWQAH